MQVRGMGEGWIRAALAAFGLFAAAFSASIAAAAEPAALAPQQAALRLDRYGDPLPPRAIARVGTTRFGGCGPIVYAPDGATYARGTIQDDIVICDAASGAPLRVLSGHAAGLYTIVYSPDGKLLATGDGRGVLQIWDAATGVRLHWIMVSQCYAFQAAFSPDGKTIATGRFGVHLWDVSTGKHLRSLNGGSKQIYGLAFLPDGKRVATVGAEDKLRLWDVAGVRETEARRLLCKSSSALAVSPDGGRAAIGGGDSRIELWDLKEMRPLRILGEPRRPNNGPAPVDDGSDEKTNFGVHSVAFSPDGRRLVATAEGGAVQVWEASSGRLVRTFDGGRIEPRWAVFSPDGKVVTAAARWGIRLHRWDVASGASLDDPAAIRGRVRGLAFPATPGAELRSWSDDGAFQSCDLRSGLVRTFPVATRSRYCMAFSHDGRTGATEAGGKGRIGFFDTATGTPLESLVGHESRITPAFGDGGSLTALQFSQDDRLLATQTSDGKLQVWDLVQRKVILDHGWDYGHQSIPTAFAPDGKTIVHALSKGALGWRELATGKILRTFVDPAGWAPTELAFSPDGGTLATAEHDHSIRFRNLHTGAAVASTVQDDDLEFFCEALVFAPDGRTVAALPDTLLSSNPRDIRLYEAATGLQVGVLEGHLGGVNAVAFSPDGRLLASASEDGTMLVWALDGHAGSGAASAPVDLEALWTSLEQRALPDVEALLWRAAAQPEAVDFLRTKTETLRPARTLKECVAELEDDRFAVREKAEHEIAAWGEAAEGALRELLADDPPVELRARAERLLHAAHDSSAPTNLRAARVVAILERSEEPAAWKLLLEWAAEDSAAPLVREAKKVKTRRDRVGAAK